MNKLLFNTSVILFPLWSLPFLPGTYSSPFHFFLLGIAPLLFCANKVRINKVDLLWLIFGFSSLSFGLVASFGQRELSVRSIIGAVYWIIFTISFLSLKVLIEEAGRTRTLNVFTNLSKVIIAFGVFEFLMKHAGSFSLIAPFNIMFSGHVSSRLQLTTSEASWAVQILLILLPFLLFNYNISRRPADLFYLVLSFVLIILCLSMTGIMIGLIAVFLYYLLFGTRWLFKLIFYGLATSAIFMFAYMWILTLDAPPYYLSRLIKLITILQSVDGQGLFINIISIDDSLFVRFGYPFIALKMWIDNPLGVGLNNFGYFFPHYLNELAINVENKHEVMRHLKNLNADPRNLFLKILVENGIFCFIVFIMILRYCVHWLRYQCPHEFQRTFRYLFVIMLGMMMQFSTPYFACYILVFSIISANYATPKK